MAVKMPKAGRIEIQGAAYEGYTVWFNSLIQSAGGQILAAPTKVAMPGPAEGGRRRSSQKLATSQGGRPVAARAEGGPEPPRVRDRRRGLPGQLPVHLPERARTASPAIFKNIAWAPVPGGRRRQARARRRSAASTGASAATRSTRTRRSPRPRACATSATSATPPIKGGLPPTLDDAVRRPAFKKEYPFGDADPRPAGRRRACARDARLRGRVAGDLHDPVAAVERRRPTEFANDLRAKRPGRARLGEALL